MWSLLLPSLSVLLPIYPFLSLSLSSSPSPSPSPKASPLSSENHTATGTLQGRPPPTDAVATAPRQKIHEDKHPLAPFSDWEGPYLDWVLRGLRIASMLCASKALIIIKEAIVRWCMPSISLERHIAKKSFGTTYTWPASWFRFCWARSQSAGSWKLVSFGSESLLATCRIGHASNLHSCTCKKRRHHIIQCSAVLPYIIRLSVIKHSSGGEEPWEDKLSEHRIRGWRAVPATGLQGQCLCKDKVFSFLQTAVSHSFSPRCVVSRHVTSFRVASSRIASGRLVSCCVV